MGFPLNKQLFSSKYKLYLPTEEELKAEIETQKAIFYLQQEEKEMRMIKKVEEKMLFLNYPKCLTCQKAKKWLDEHNLEYSQRHIVEDNPSYDELKEWYEKSGLLLKKFFNTSGLLYKKMELKNKLPLMSEDEQLKLLETNGMLVKRPIVINKDKVLVGFKENEWKSLL